MNILRTARWFWVHGTPLVFADKKKPAQYCIEVDEVDFGKREAKNVLQDLRFWGGEDNSIMNRRRMGWTQFTDSRLWRIFPVFDIIMNRLADKIALHSGDPNED